ncbi:MAG TPA: hypothetical protein VG013_04045, partial [Gemmataceae bacterium]|nr:hypothetical protein [Gemmataceae bacterium]
MAANTISCPECHVTLKVAGTPPRGQGARVTCPRCGSQFSMTADAFRPAAWVPPESTPAIPPVRSQLAEEDVEPPRNLAWRTFFPALLLAIAAACFVVGASIFAAVHFSGNREPAAQQTPPALVVEKPPEPRPKQEDTEQERKAKEKELREFTSLMIQAGIAKSSKRYDDAVKAYGDALKLFPDDAEAAQGLRESQAALSAKADTKADDEKRRAEFERLMKQGEEAMTAKKFAEAVRAFEVAIQVMPSRAEATKAAQQAKAALDKDQGERKKLAEYRDRMTAGRAAMVDERYGDAVREFVAALGLLPGDAAATKGRRDAQKMVRAAADEDKHKDDFTRLMDQAGAALRNH